MQNLRAAMNGTATAASSTDDYRKLIEECQTLRSPRLDVVPVLVTDIRKAFEDARLRITPEGEALLDELTHRSLIYFRHFLKSHENAEKHFSAVKVRTYDLVSHLQRIEIRRQQGLAHDYGHFWMNQAEDCVERKPRSSDGSDSSDSGISTNESVKQDKVCTRTSKESVPSKMSFPRKMNC
ncbi:hypothetical protein RvY_12943 [Ramazzottius varieornatus]|uniref:Uncharacterized protein n=1 Tax=Ramazzottius varieornatus TaxID=947166 RepID=A0A1D1VL77_RAMVA|nr:hypothetical protein RvY_12943 [Ramazzottius varieornatus]